MELFTNSLFYAQVFALTISCLAYKKESVNVSGFISMIVISSFFIWNNGLAELGILFSMFTSCSLVSKYKKLYKDKLTEKVVKKHGSRDAIQAICNLGTATVCFYFYTVTYSPYLIVALISSVAGSNADSWASEIGVLSKKKPVLIHTLKVCKPGISGGVTALGTLAGVAGAVFIAIVSVSLINFLNLSQLNISSLKLFVIVTLSGVFGLFFDSLLGATIQVIYKNTDNEETENPDLAIQISRGKSINNDMVNLITSIVVALFSTFLLFLLNK